MGDTNILHRATGLTYSDPSTSQMGHVLLAPFASDQVFLVNPDGEIAHRWQSALGLPHASYLLENGNLWVNELSDEPRGVPLTTSGIMRERAANGSVVWEHHDPWQHHDARPLATGGTIYLAYLPPEEQAAARFTGGVPGSEPPGGLFGECVREVDETGHIVWEWSTAALPDDLRRLHRNANRCLPGT